MHEIFRYIFRKTLVHLPCPYAEEYTTYESTRTQKGSARPVNGAEYTQVHATESVVLGLSQWRRMEEATGSVEVLNMLRK